MSATTFFVGRIGSDPETRETSAGPVTNFLLIRDKYIPGRDGAKGRNKTFTYRITAWGKGLASALNGHIKNGDLVTFQAEAETGTFERDGVKHYTTDFVMDQNARITRLSQAEKNRNNDDYRDFNGDDDR